MMRCPKIPRTGGFFYFSIFICLVPFTFFAGTSGRICLLHTDVVNTPVHMQYMCNTQPGQNFAVYIIGGNYRLAGNLANHMLPDHWMVLDSKQLSSPCFQA